MIPIVIGLGIDAAFGAGVAATAVVGTLTVGGLVSSIVVGGIAIGAAALLKSGKPGGATSNFQPPQNVTVEAAAQSIGARFFIAGEYPCTGIYHYRAVAASHLIYGYIYNCEPVYQMVAHWIDDELQSEVAINYGTATIADGTVSQPNAGRKMATQILTVWYGGTWQQIPGPVIPAAIYEFHKGSDAGERSAVLGYLIPTVWTADFKCQGLCHGYGAYLGQSISGVASTMAGFMSVYPNGANIRDRRLLRQAHFDPRDPDQNFNDRTTWKFTRNPALIWAWYWTHIDGGRLPYSMLDWDSVEAAANYCDVQVPAFGGGTEARYVCSFRWDASQSISDVTTRILAACDAIQYDQGGKLKIWCLQSTTPEITLTEADFTSVQWDEEAGALVEFNYAQGQYAEPRINYASMATPPITNDDSIAAVGERPHTVPLDYVTSANQAYRLTHRVMRRINPPKIVRGTVIPSGMRAIGEFVVTLDMPSLGVTGTYMPTKLFDMPPTGERATIEFWQVSSDAFDDVVMPEDPVSPSLGGSIPTGSVATVLSPTAIPHSLSVTTITAQAWTYQVTNGTWIDPSALPSQGTPIDNSLRFYVQSRQVDPTTHVSLGDGSWTADTDNAVIWDNYADQWTLVSPALTASATYELRAWFVSVVTGAMSTPLAGVYQVIP